MVFVRFLSDSANADSINTHTVSETPSPTHAGRVMADGPSWGAACAPKAPSSKTASVWVLIKKDVSSGACAVVAPKSKWSHALSQCGCRNADGGDAGATRLA